MTKPVTGRQCELDVHAVVNDWPAPLLRSLFNPVLNRVLVHDQLGRCGRVTRPVGIKDSQRFAQKLMVLIIDRE